MAYDSLILRSQLLVGAATIGAHANLHEDGNGAPGFRQKDVKFLVELFSNWVETAFQGSGVRAQNTQVMRYLQSLVEDGYARVLMRKSHPYYRLTRTGLIELVSRIVHDAARPNREHFFFLFYFIRNYQPRIEEVVKSEGRQFPYALKVELDSLLDHRTTLSRELQAAERELKKLEARIRDALKTSELISSGLKEKRPLESLVREAEKLYPYELNSQKPLTELIASIPEKTRLWELQIGNVRRAEQIWTPSKAILNVYIQELRALDKACR